MILADSGHFIAVLNPLDALHGRAVAWSEAVRERLLVTEYVLWECVNYFSTPGSRMKAGLLAAKVRSTPACEFVPATRALLEAGLELHQGRPDKEWSLTDCVSFVVMKQRGITQALSFDHNFEEAGFVALLRRDPQ
jgi:predicted nucleic acid-binding protein